VSCMRSYRENAWHTVVKRCLQIHGYHVCKAVWTPVLDEVLEYVWEENDEEES